VRNLSLEDKLFFFERNFFTLDGLWMIETEEEMDWKIALKIDLAVWKKLLKIIIRRLTKYLKIETNSLNNLIKILTFRWSAEGWDYELKQNEFDKAEIIIKKCPYKAAMDRNPDRQNKISLICKDMCIPFYRSIIRDFNTEITVKRTKYMGLGDDFCNFNFYLDKSIFDKEEKSESVKQFRRISKKDKFFYFEKNFRTLDGLWVIETEKEIDWDTALKLDIKVWQRLYSIIFRRVKKYLKLEGNSLNDLIEILSFIWNCEGNIHEIFQEGEKKAVINITKCPYIEAMERNPDRRHRIESICKEMCIPYLEPVIKEFNPKINYIREKFIGTGDSICDFILKMEE